MDNRSSLESPELPVKAERQPSSNCNWLPPTPPSTTLPLPTSEVLHTICDFLGDEDRYTIGCADLTLSPVSLTSYNAFHRELQNPSILSGKYVDRVRYRYCPETSVLTIPCMSTPPHDCITRYTHDVDRLMCNKFISTVESRCVTFAGSEDVELPSLSCVGAKGHSTAVKQPDAAIYFADPDTNASDKFPRVVFEVAFSQSLASVREDAKNWLVRGGGYVKLVIIVKLKEGKHPAAELDNDEVQKKNVEQCFGTGDDQQPSQQSAYEASSLHSNDTDSDCSHSSQSPTASSYQTHHDESTAPWVGPISGFMELYLIDAITGEVYRDGPSYDIFPKLKTGTTEADENLPKIRITDLLPETHIIGPRDRTFSLPFDAYRYRLKVAIQALASNRQAHQKKMKRKGEIDSEYIPETEGGSEKTSKRKRAE